MGAINPCINFTAPHRRAWPREIRDRWGQGKKKHQLNGSGREEGDGEVCVVNRRQQNEEERSGFISRHNPDNQKKRRGGTAKGKRVEGTEGWQCWCRGETGGKRGLVAGPGPGWCGANRPPGTLHCRTIWGAVKGRGAAGAPGWQATAAPASAVPLEPRGPGD